MVLSLLGERGLDSLERRAGRRLPVFIGGAAVLQLTALGGNKGFVLGWDWFSALRELQSWIATQALCGFVHSTQCVHCKLLCTCKTLDGVEAWQKT